MRQHAHLKKQKKACPPPPLVNHEASMKTKIKLNSHFAVVLAATFLLSNASNAAITIPVTSGSFENFDVTFQAGRWANLDLAWENGTADGLGYQQNDGDHITADNGAWSVLLSNNIPIISQDLLTTVNAGDTLTLIFSGGKGGQEGSNGGGVFTATFDVGGTNYTTSFDTTGNAATWETFTLTHTILNSGNLSLEFAHQSGRAWLDTVGSVSIPEPSALLLLSFGGLGLLRRRRA